MKFYKLKESVSYALFDLQLMIDKYVHILAYMLACHGAFYSLYSNGRESHRSVYVNSSSDFFVGSIANASFYIFSVAMLERNLMRLFYNYHHPDRQYEDRYKAAFEARHIVPWYGNPVQIYTAFAATAILAMLIAKSK